MDRSPDATGEVIRSDGRAPTLVLQSETDVVYLGSLRADQRDGPNLRLWEVAGSAHADTYLLVAGHHDDGARTPDELAALLAPTRELAMGSCDTPINAGPQQHYVGMAALAALDEWVRGGQTPPAAPRLDRAGSELVRDGWGIATGGIRSPWVDVPTATLSGLGQTGDGFAVLFGTTRPFDDATLSSLYPAGRGEYMAAFAASLDRTIAEGFIRAADREEILAIAAASWPK
jgi:hypothetical protein